VGFIGNKFVFGANALGFIETVLGSVEKMLYFIKNSTNMRWISEM